MKEIGELEITLREKMIEEEFEGRIGLCKAGLYSVISIIDDGSGMHEDVLSHIFEPFFTTMDVGKGTGLGLAVVFGIIQSHEGNILVKSEPGKGTEFQIFFPKTNESINEEEYEEKIVTGGNEHILFVDDEQDISIMSKEILSDLGYQVTAFSESLNAFESFKSGMDIFDIVITDQTMPGLTGLELSKKILQLKPDIPIILCTGYSNLIDERKVLDAGIRKFIMKPYDMDELAIAIRSTLDEKTIVV